MKVIHTGDKTRAKCRKCGEVVSTTYAYRDVSFNRGRNVAPDVLVGVCDQCNTVIATTPQSIAALARAKGEIETPLKLTITAREMEILEIAADRIAPRANNRLRETLIAHFLRRSMSDAGRAARLEEQCAKKPKRRPRNLAMPKMELSLKLAHGTKEGLKTLMKSTGLRKSQIFRGIISQIEEEIVLPKHPAGMKRLRELADILTA